jgi:hypothetical protein
MLTIQVAGQLEQRLKDAAATSGADPQALAERLLEEHLPNPNQATIDLLAKWEKDEFTSDSVELARRQADGEQFMQSLAENRVASEGAVARKLWP